MRIARIALLAGLLVELTGHPVACAAGITEAGRGVAFVSPDGRRVVRLILEKQSESDERATRWLGLDAAMLAELRALGPTLVIEFSSVDRDRELLIRTFSTLSGAGKNARYRVIWDDASRRFLVLCTTAPMPSRLHHKVSPRWSTGESVLFWFDRTTEWYSPIRDFESADWEGFASSTAPEGRVLPMIDRDNLRTGKSPQRSPGTGEMEHRLYPGPSQKQELFNFTTEPNTQNVAFGKKWTNPGLPVKASSLSPDGRFTAKLVLIERYLLVVLAEGDHYRDETWVLVPYFRVNNKEVAPLPSSEHRLLWSRDSRYLLMVEQEAPLAGFEQLADGMYIYLLFDTIEWNGVLAPARRSLAHIDFADLRADSTKPVTR